MRLFRVFYVGTEKQREVWNSNAGWNMKSSAHSSIPLSAPPHSGSRHCYRVESQFGPWQKTFGRQRNRSDFDVRGGLAAGVRNPLCARLICCPHSTVVTRCVVDDVALREQCCVHMLPSWIHKTVQGWGLNPPVAVPPERHYPSLPPERFLPFAQIATRRGRNRSKSACCDSERLESPTITTDFSASHGTEDTLP